MRFHRYGKHGPDAWLHKRKYRFPQQRSLPVLASPVAVVRTQDAVDKERIITIVRNPSDEYSSDIELEDEGEEQALTSDQQLLQAPEDEKIMYAQLKKWAEFEAGAFFSRTEQAVKDRGGEWPLDETIAREAENKAYVALRQFVNPSLDIESAKNFYIDIYLKRFQHLYVRSTGDGALPNEKTQRLAELAKIDAQHDREQNHLNEGAFEQALTVQAILRVQEVYTFLTGFGTGHVAHILSHVDSYKRPYREECRRLARADSFPGSGIQPRRYPGAQGTA